jgi:DNA-binding CsgD family transcriptional regulator
MSVEKPNVDLIHSVWKNAKKYISKKEVVLEGLDFDELTNSIFSNGPFYYFIVDFSSMKINYMSLTVQEIHGFDPENVVFQDILGETHPDDMIFVARAEAAAWNIVFNKIERSENKKYKISYCFRLKIHDGSYKLFHHQCIILTTDEEGNVCKTLNIHTNINHLTTQNNYKVSAIGMFGEPSYMDIPLTLGEGNFLSSKQLLFTKRETEVIQLMAAGLTSIEISEKLFISIHTVNTHRKNIMHKSDCKTVAQLVIKCITEGVIQQ